MSGHFVLVRSARHLLTLRGAPGPRRGPALRELGIINDGALLIKDGIIVDASLTRRIENLSAARDAEVIDATGRVVMPAFVDGNVQLLSPLRSDDDAQVFPEVEPRREQVKLSRYLAQTSSQRLAARGRVWLERFARHGTGTLEAVSGPGPTITGPAKALRIYAEAKRHPLTLIATFLAENPEDFGTGNATAFQLLVHESLPTIARRRLAHFLAIAPGRNGLKDAQNALLVQTARTLGLQLHLLADGLSGAAGVSTALTLGARTLTNVSHLQQKELRALASSQLITRLTPAWGEPGAAGVAQARALVDHGAAVALATGFSPGRSGGYSMQEVIRDAAERGGLSAAEAILAATVNAAHAAGAGAQAGSLEPGKRGDFIMLDAPDYRDLFIRPGSNLVHSLIKGGRVVYQEGDVI